MEELKGMFTEEHIKLINKEITKAIKGVDFKYLVTEAIQREFDYIYEACDLKHSIEDMVTQVIYEHLVKAGLLKDKK